jgi:anti-sigma factor RsiW
MKRTDANHSQHHCIALFERLSEYIDRELDASTCNDIEAHIKACKPCQVCLNTLKQTVDLCRNLKHRQVPRTFSLKLKEAIVDLIGTPSE